MTRKEIFSIILLLVFTILGLNPLSPLIADTQSSESYWLPTGYLDVGKSASERQYSYRSTGVARMAVLKYADGVPVTDGYRDIAGDESFTVKLRPKKAGASEADLVLIKRVENGMPAVRLKVQVDGKELQEPWIIQLMGISGTCADTFYVVPAAELAGKKEVNIRLTAEEGSIVRSFAYRFYLTCDFQEIPEDYKAAYGAALRLELARDWNRAEKAFRRLAGKDPTGVVGRLSRMRARYALYEQKSTQPTLSAKSRYLLGLYCMENGFWEGAVRELEMASQLDPKNPEIWYKLAEAHPIRDGMTGDEIEALIPLYRKSAELRKVSPNVLNVYVGIFKKIWLNVDDGNDGESKQLFELDNVDVDRIQKEWGWMSDVLWAASKGNLKLNNNFKIFDNEVDGTDPKAFNKLWKPGDFGLFVRFSGLAQSDVRGVDSGINRAATIWLGASSDWQENMRQLNRALDWYLNTSENGKGMPVTDWSDWCGFQPNLSIGIGIAARAHYYITPGMFLSIRGYEAKREDYLTKWRLYKPYECQPGAGLDTEFMPENKTDFSEVFAVDTTDKHIPSAWIDLKKLLAPTAEEVVGYASCYIYSPLRQKTRVWLGMNDAIKVWINGRQAYAGSYNASGNWNEADEPDQVAPLVMLEKGWNSVLVKVENLPKSVERLSELGKKDNGWGFSMRISGMNNESLIGVSGISSKPAGWADPNAKSAASKNKLYNWEDVADDYSVKLPRLTEQDLAAWTGLPNITVSADGLITASGAQQWLDGYDENDRLLNNELNHRFESAAVLRYLTQKKKPRDLVFLRPEAYETYIQLMKAPNRYKIKRHSNRVLGYILLNGLAEYPNGRIMLVLDTFLGDRLPEDEKDLLDITKL